MQNLETRSLPDSGISKGKLKENTTRSTQEQKKALELSFLTLAEKLDANSRTPLYRQVSSGIEQWVDEGRLKPGTRLTSERRLTELLKVSRRTIRAAFASLIERHYISSTHGRGNFVLEPPSRKELRFLSLERFAPNHWHTTPYHYDLIHKAETATNTVVHYKYAPTVEKLRAILLSPPSGYHGILIARPIQDWVDVLLALDGTPLPIPLLVDSRDLSGSGLNFISANHFAQTYQATLKLIRIGHRRIGYISGIISATYMQIARKGYFQALSEEGMERYEEDILLLETMDFSVIERALQPFLAERRFDAVVVAGSAFSMPFEKVIQASSTVIPDQLSAILITEQYTLDRLTMRWTAHVYPDLAVMQRSLEALCEIHRGQIRQPVQQLIPHITHEGATCRAVQR